MPTICRDGVNLYFEEHGTGLPMLFHTGGGGDGRMWELAGYTGILTGFRQLLLDHRGHGRSDTPSGLDAHRIEEYVADSMAVLDAAGADQAVVVGYSGGGSVAYRLAAGHPNRCAALVAIGSVPVPSSDPEPRLEYASHVRAVGVRAAMEEFAGQEDEPAPPWLIDHLSTTSTEMFAVALEAWAQGPNTWDALAGIKAPTLIVCGEHEQDDGEADRAAARLADGEAQVLPGYGHLQTFWHAEVTGLVISRFLKGRGLC
jgi:pimeloyl-ACP methyl ester carboxylesterase